jgi:Putative Ig domain
MLDSRVKLTNVCFAMLFAALSGCHDDSSSAAVSSNAVASVGTPSGESSDPTAAASITGTPVATANVGAAYAFTPIVKADDSAELTFAVANQPAWAAFNASNGKLSGTPTSADVGEYKNISIEVRNGNLKSSLAPFSIEVKPPSEVATITWEAPTEASGAAAVTGYHVYYGASAGSMTHVIDISNVKDTSYVINNLATGTWYFAMTSYDAAKVESDRSTPVMVTL